MINYPVKTFKYGVVNNLEAQSIPDGAFADALNWLTKGDKMELSRGFALIGAEISGLGEVNSIHVSRRFDGVEILYAKIGRKLFYYNTATGLFVEVGTDIFPAAAEDDEMAFSDYESPAGSQMWFSSPNSSIYKIMTANPTSYTDMYDSTVNFKGYLRIKYNRTILWGRTTDQTGVYGSYVDSQIYTTVTAEARHNGDGSTKTFTGTLAFKGAGAKRTCFGVQITDGTETFTDDVKGVLTGSAGGTGTINYTTGEYSVTFNAAPIAGVNNITATYQWENSNNNGISDFSKSTPRTAGQGFIFRQDDGGGRVQTVLSIGDVEFCIHENKTWALTITATDTSATNLIFRDKVGIPNWRAAVATGRGIYYMDTTEASSPKFKLMTFESGSTEIIPETVTLNFNFNDYRFDQCQMEEWDEYIVFIGRHKSSTRNNRMFMYHKTWGSIDVRDYFAKCIDVMGGALIGGDSISENVYTFFSGFDDNDAEINNYLIGNISSLGIERLKKTKKLVVEGEIVPNQIIQAYQSNDRGGWVLVGEIDGNGSYVDFGQRVLVGSATVGSLEIGGGSADVYGYHYKREIRLTLDKFWERQLKFVATGIGYASISAHTDFDVREKGRKLPNKYRS